jgi:uncharacterized membrane protein
MNWVLGLIGALVGIVVSESREFLGAIVGFFTAFTLVSLHQLRREVVALSRDLAVSKGRLAALSVAAAPQAAPSAEATAGPVATPASAPIETSAASETPIAAHVAAAEIASEDAAASSFAAASAAVAAAENAASAASGTLPPPSGPPRIPRAPARPAEPGWEDRLIAKIKAWFTEGNVPVKIGVLVLLFGVAAALRYAAAQGLFTLPIEVRLALIAAAGIAGLAFGWRERERRPAFGLSLQGGALGVLLLTVFAAYRLYSLLPPALAFALIIVLVAGSALLAVLQQNMALAVLGFLGGYLAPVLISTGSHNHVGLFSYYAVLNAAVFAISWRQSWRLLNLVGFVFTFGVGAAWGSKFYRPELFATVEPFLILFFLFYIVIGLLYVVRQSEHRRPWVDGTLVFGTPLLAFPMQAALLKDDKMGLAFSALAVALLYAGLVYWLRQRRGERLLTEAYGALALGFATLAVPLAFSANTTASVWALEGAGVAWLGIRQNRNFPWLSGLGLQWLAAGAYVLSLFKDGHDGLAENSLLLINADWLGAAMLSFSGFALALIHDRHRPRFALPPLLFAWGTLWWLVGAATQMDLAEQSALGLWRFSMLYLAASIATAALLRDLLRWPRLNWLIALSALTGFIYVFVGKDEFGAPLATPALLTWLAYALAVDWALWSARETSSRTLAATHLAILWTLALALTMQGENFADQQSLAQGWEFIALVAPLALLTLGLWRRPALFAWPRETQFKNYRVGWFGLAIPLLMLGFVAGLFMEGSATPLVYLPLLNPLDLALLAVAFLVWGLFGEFAALRELRRFWPVLAFAFITMATLRGVHHVHGEPWSDGILRSGFSQASLTVVWSLLGVGAWILGSRRRNRQVWMGGAVLMGIVLLKLLMVDRGYMGNMPGIISFMAVGLLLVGVGYIAPSPPKRQEAGESA